MDRLSNAKEIKKMYEEVLADGEPHSRKELFSYANRFAEAGKKYTDGMLTGSLRTLVTDTDDYECISRGIYRKKPEECRTLRGNTLVEGYIELFEETLKKSATITSSPFYVLKMREEDKKKMYQIERCLEMISATLEEIKKGQ